MRKIEKAQPKQIGGTELGKVLHFYGLLEQQAEYKIVCPFHEDVNASCKVDLVRGTFYCFGCTKSGDALEFVKLANSQLDDLQACRLFWEILRSDEVKDIKIERKPRAKLENLEALEVAHDYYYGLSKTDWSWELQSAEYRYMQQRGFNIQSLNKCGAKINYNAAYPIIFPMNDMGEFKGWVCRTMNARIQKHRKYLYNDGFVKTNTLVGRYDSKVVMLVEGYMDWLKTKQFGIKKSAAILGWHISDAQIKKLKMQGVEYIISALDNDKCGKEGTRYLERFFKVIRFQYPEGIKDPGDMTKQIFDIANNKTKQLYKEVIKADGLNRRY